MEPKRILLVDDDSLVALFAKDELEAEGFEVLGPATRLDVALRMAREPELHAAILDVNIAGQYVWPVAQVLTDRGIPFLFLSGYGAAFAPPPFCRNRRRMAKPFTGDGLLDAVAQLLRDQA